MIRTIYILDTPTYANDYYSKYLHPLQALVPHIYTDSILMKLYEESWHQVIDCLEFNFKAFTESLSYFPRPELFIGSDYLRQSGYISNISIGFKDLAMAVYFDLTNRGILTDTSNVTLMRIFSSYLMLEQFTQME